MRLRDVTAVVTGGAQGIGEAIVRRFVAEGARVIVADIDAVAGRRLAAELGEATTLFSEVDVTLEADWARLFMLPPPNWRSISVLVNNAGMTLRSGIEGHSPEDWRRILEVNLTGAFLGIRAVAPIMANAGGGSIINMSSVAGVVATRFPAYTASKWGLRGLTRAAALDLAADNIRVNAICPGVIDTGFGGRSGPARHGRAAMERVGRANEVAAAAAYLASVDASFVTGSDLSVDGGLSISVLR